jgi:hypothetical protein
MVVAWLRVTRGRDPAVVLGQAQARGRRAQAPEAVVAAVNHSSQAYGHQVEASSNGVRIKV